jgi:peptidoglycan/xylan/chitin deacetylase (PgdA/CDA1 family)
MSAAQRPLILTYHSISDGHSPLKIPPKLFAQQMEWLHANVRTVPLGELVAAVSARKTLPDRTVVLTFDDGFRDFYVAAAPVLRRLKLPATIFLPSGYCGRANAWPGQPAWVKEEDLLSWQEVSELANDGFSFGAHSVNHPNLTALPISVAEREIVASKVQIENHVGKPVEFFAYPYGRWNAAVRELVGNHYRGACSTAAAAVGPNCDPLALPRADVNYLRNPVCFQGVFTKSLVAYLFARRLIRRLRGQPEGFISKLQSVSAPRKNM